MGQLKFVGSLRRNRLCRQELLILIWSSDSAIRTPAGGGVTRASGAKITGTQQAQRIADGNPIVLMTSSVYTVAYPAPGRQFTRQLSSIWMRQERDNYSAELTMTDVSCYEYSSTIHQLSNSKTQLAGDAINTNWIIAEKQYTSNRNEPGNHLE